MSREDHTSETTPREPGSGRDQESPDALRRLTEGSSAASGSRLSTRLRNYFLTGLIVMGPVGITLYIVWWFVNLVDAWIKPLLPAKYLPEHYLPFSVPGVGLIVAIIGLMVIGGFTANLFGRTLIGYGETMLNRMPVVRNVYSGLKQIFETVLSQSSNTFQKVGLIEYPRKGLYALVFVSKETKGEVDDKTGIGEPFLSVFLPTTPNPTSGFLLFVPKKDVVILEMTVEQAAKLVISAGLVVPHYQSKLKQLADDAKPRPAKLQPREKKPA